MLGLTMIGIGNLLPRTRPNLAIGIRTHRSLADRTLWARIHRAAGYLLVTSGMVIVLASVAAPAPVSSSVVLVTGPVMLVGAWLLVRFADKRVHVAFDVEYECAVGDATGSGEAGRGRERTRSGRADRGRLVHDWHLFNAKFSPRAAMHRTFLVIE